MFQVKISNPIRWSVRKLNWHHKLGFAAYVPVCQISYSTKKINLISPVFLEAKNHGRRIAIVDEHGSHTYDNLLKRCDSLTEKILNMCKTNQESSINGARISILTPNSSLYVVSQWAVWQSGGVCVPLCDNHPASEWSYFLKNSESSLVIATEEFRDKLEPLTNKLGIKLLILDEHGNSDNAQRKEFLLPLKNKLEQWKKANRFKHTSALIVYTSGTTGRPKGVVHTFGSLQSQMDGMVTAWEWSPQDVILHVLPLHHVHGIINVLMTPLYVGATCVMMAKFNAKEVWSALMTTSRFTSYLPRPINMFMAVPTIYAKLIEEFHSRFPDPRKPSHGKEFIKAVCQSKIRLMVSGSAALPQPIMQQWEEITGHLLLERYGMTEIGMALTNPLFGYRIPGSVGKPFPGVEVRIVEPNVYSENGYDVIAQGDSKRTVINPGKEEAEGELLVKGPNLFSEYFNNPDATKDAFFSGRWFKTGDTACYKDGAYKILGRTSVDIIKSGGYKISALEIERHILSHDDIIDVAVVGLPDITWGQKVAAVIVTKPGADSRLDVKKLKMWAQDKMPPYHVPSVLKILDSLPKNEMGKVNKKHLTSMVFTDELKAS